MHASHERSAGTVEHMSVERVVDWQRAAHDSVASCVGQTLAACFWIVWNRAAKAAQGRRAHVRRGGVQLAKARTKLQWRRRCGRWRWWWERRGWRRARRLCRRGVNGNVRHSRQRRLLAQAEVVGAERQLDVDAAVGVDKAAKFFGDRRIHTRGPCSWHEEGEIKLGHWMSTVDPKVNGVWLICVDDQVMKRAVDWQSGVDGNDEVKVGRWRRRNRGRWPWRRGRRTCAHNQGGGEGSCGMCKRVGVAVCVCACVRVCL